MSICLSVDTGPILLRYGFLTPESWHTCIVEFSNSLFPSKLRRRWFSSEALLLHRCNESLPVARRRLPPSRSLSLRCVGQCLVSVPVGRNFRSADPLLPAAAFCFACDLFFEI